MSEKVHVGLVQMAPNEDPRKSLEKALAGITDAVRRGAHMVCLPELFMGPYFCQSRDDQEAFERAEPIPGPTSDVLAGAAKRHGIVLVGGTIFEQGTEGKYYNTAPVFEVDGSLLGTYRKTHIPEDPLFHEQHYFQPGNTGYKVFTTTRGRIAVLICYDQWFPEAARAAALNGAEIIFYPTAIGTIDEEVEENITGDWQGMWETVQRGHAGANNVFVASLNRVGKERALHFWGGSFIADPSAALLTRGGNAEEVIVGTVDLSRVRPLQKAWHFFDKRRPETYGDILKNADPTA